MASIEKLVRTHFQGNEGLHVPPEREAVIAELRRRFQGEEWQEARDLRGWIRAEEDRLRHLCTFVLDDEPRIWTGCRSEILSI